MPLAERALEPASGVERTFGRLRPAERTGEVVDEAMFLAALPVGEARRAVGSGESGFQMFIQARDAPQAAGA